MNTSNTLSRNRKDDEHKLLYALTVSNPMLPKASDACMNLCFWRAEITQQVFAHSSFSAVHQVTEVLESVKGRSLCPKVAQSGDPPASICGVLDHRVPDWRFGFRHFAGRIGTMAEQ